MTRQRSAVSKVTSLNTCCLPAMGGPLLRKPVGYATKVRGQRLGSGARVAKPCRLLASVLLLLSCSSTLLCSQVFT